MNTKQVIVMRKDLNMRKGKMCAQAAHASLGVFTDMLRCEHTLAGPSLTPHIKQKFYFETTSTSAISKWLNGSFKKITVGVNSEEELIALYEHAKKVNLPCILITDSGLTEFNGEPTNTCIAIGPAEDREVDIVTGGLKLL